MRRPPISLTTCRWRWKRAAARVAFHTLYPAGLDTPIRVDYRLRVPRQVRLDELSTLKGDIVVHDVEGIIEAHNLHGDIEGINVAGSVEAHALTGNILVSLRALPDPRLPFTLATINGNVDLLMPAQANADLELSTVAGNIVGDYPFQVSSTPGDSTRRAQVGRGACGWNCARCAETFVWASAMKICRWLHAGNHPGACGTTPPESGGEFLKAPLLR